jgi:hypothetical protein
MKIYGAQEKFHTQPVAQQEGKCYTSCSTYFTLWKIMVCIYCIEAG